MNGCIGPVHNCMNKTVMSMNIGGGGKVKVWHICLLAWIKYCLCI